VNNKHCNELEHDFAVVFTNLSDSKAKRHFTILLCRKCGLLAHSQQGMNPYTGKLVEPFPYPGGPK
jgi:hypothetical protein